jgi:hypothetical protein
MSSRRIAKTAELLQELIGLGAALLE